MDTDEAKQPVDAIPQGVHWQPEIQHRNYFLMGGLAFLGTALILYGLTGYMVFTLNQMGPNIAVSETAPSSTGTLSQIELYNFFGRILSFALAPLIGLLAAIICTVVGTRLLRSSGAVTTQVISPQDYPILGPAISAGNEQAISQFIRLSSLSGTTGTFTKIGSALFIMGSNDLTLTAACRVFQRAGRPLPSGFG